jgi:hypothetical protein
MPFDPTAFANAESDFNRDEPPANGEYEVRLSDTDIISAKDGRQFAKLTYTVLTGFARDHIWGVVHTLDAMNPQGDPNPGLAITKRTLRDLGVNVDEVQSVKDLRDELARVQGGIYLVEVSRNGQYVNTRPKRRLEGVQDQMPVNGDAQRYGQPPPQNAILGSDFARRDLERTGESDITPAGATEGFDRSRAPKQGEIDPETGEPIPF